MVELKEMRRVVGFLALSLGLGLGACSSNNSATAGPDGAAAGATPKVTCSKDPRAETFIENLTHPGDNIKNKMPGLTFVLAKATDEPPAVENQSWTLKILDASGQAVKDAQVSLPGANSARPADPWMPDHGHGSVGSAKKNDDGTYTIGNLNFFMGGIWSTYISATSGSMTDSTTFTFCVEGG